MSESQYQLFARQFVDMWQQQLGNMLKDDRIVSGWVDFMTQNPLSQPGNIRDAQPFQTSAEPSVPPGTSDDPYRKLAARLAGAEQRIAALECQLAAHEQSAPKRRTTGTRKA